MLSGALILWIISAILFYPLYRRALFYKHNQADYANSGKEKG